MSKKKMLFLIILVGVLFVAIYNYYFSEHSMKIALLDEQHYDSSYSHAYGEKYFFIKDDEYNNFYDGIGLLEYYLPDYDFSQLNTKEYTYLIAVNGEVEEVLYSRMNCNYRNPLGLQDEYIGKIGYKSTDDEIRIYQMKKINMDYDYHSE